LSLPDGYDKVPTDYVLLVQQAVLSGKPILVIDEPLYPLDDDAYQTVSRLLAEALQRGATVVAVGDYNTPNQIQLCQPSI
jgi:alpha-D-ribose 1-methylphosphonate 5-triphosphate synthase subunit PhnL